MTVRIVTWTYGSGHTVNKVRLIAEEGKVLTNDGEAFWNCIDVDTTEGWHEVDSSIIEDQLDTQS